MDRKRVCSELCWFGATILGVMAFTIALIALVSRAGQAWPLMSMILNVGSAGAGTGYFSVRLAHLVPKGRVYAVDTEPHMMQHLAKRAQHEKLVNVSALVAAPDDARLPQKADLALLVDVYHHIDDRDRYFRRL